MLIKSTELQSNLFCSSFKKIILKSRQIRRKLLGSEDPNQSNKSHFLIFSLEVRSGSVFLPMMSIKYPRGRRIPQHCLQIIFRTIGVKEPVLFWPGSVFFDGPGFDKKSCFLKIGRLQTVLNQLLNTPHLSLERIHLFLSIYFLNSPLSRH